MCTWAIGSRAVSRTVSRGGDTLPERTRRAIIQTRAYGPRRARSLRETFRTSVPGLGSDVNFHILHGAIRALYNIIVRLYRAVSLTFTARESTDVRPPAGMPAAVGGETKEEFAPRGRIILCELIAILSFRYFV